VKILDNNKTATHIRYTVTKENNPGNTYKTKSKVPNLIITSNEEDPTSDLDLEPSSYTKSQKVSS